MIKRNPFGARTPAFILVQRNLDPNRSKANLDWRSIDLDHHLWDRQPYKAGTRSTKRTTKTTTKDRKGPQKGEKKTLTNREERGSRLSNHNKFCWQFFIFPKKVVSKFFPYNLLTIILRTSVNITHYLIAKFITILKWLWDMEILNKMFGRL